MTVAPYGSWASPITAEELASSSSALHWQHAFVSAGKVYWSQALGEEDGRTSIFSRDLETGETIDLTPGRNVRNSVNEYGGGEWVAAEGTVIYSDWPSGDLRIITEPSGSEPLTDVDPNDAGQVWVPGHDNAVRYGCLSYYPERKLVLGIREEHHGEENRQSVFAARIGSNHTSTLATGADFYAYPVLSAFGMLAWMEWDLPNMPWDETRIMAAPLDDLTHPIQVSSADGQAAICPAWAPDGALIYLSDLSGYWNFYRWDPTSGAPAQQLHTHPHDFAGPIWAVDPVPYSIIDERHIGCTWLEDGVAKLGVLSFDPADPGTAALQPLPSPAVAAIPFGHGRLVAAQLGYPDRPAELVTWDWDSGATKLIATDADPSPVAPGHCAKPALDPAFVSAAQAISWDSPDGPVHAWYYPPANPGFQAPSGELPPVQVWSHGGPTGFASPDFRLSVQYWTTRGIGILDVNYSGSSGYGRDYRNRLRGQWGILDVRDCAALATQLVRQGLADPARLSIRGGSAGGYTTLQALATTDVFAAGISLYGVADLEALATDTHKFESRYLDSMVAPYPAQRQVYLDRSPIYHLDQVSCPMLILQGADDKIVPPQQAYDLAAAVEAKGLKATLIVFEGEGHGFRKPENVIASAEAALKFLGETFGFIPTP